MLLLCCCCDTHHRALVSYPLFKNRRKSTPKSHTQHTPKSCKNFEFFEGVSPFCFVLLSEGLFRRKTHRLLLLQHNDNDNISHRIYNHTEYNSEIKNDTNDVFFFFFFFFFLFFLVVFLGGGSKPEKQNSITVVVIVVFKKDGDDDEKKKKKNFLGKIVIFDRIIGETESFDFGFR